MKKIFAIIQIIAGTYGLLVIFRILGIMNGYATKIFKNLPSVLLISALLFTFVCGIFILKNLNKRWPIYISILAWVLVAISYFYFISQFGFEY
ncbi:MAG TPA: hypothetical protein VJH71_00310 [Candidatus Paceibacterota bacterium]